MKKDLIVVFALVWLILLAVPAYAVTISYDMGGTFVGLDPYGDPFGWAGQQWSLSLSIDSNKAPSLVQNSEYWQSYSTLYWADSSVFKVGSEVMNLDAGGIDFERSPGADFGDQVFLHAFDYDLDWVMRVSAQFDYNTFGDNFPISVTQELDLSSARNVLGYVESYGYPGDQTDVIYTADVISKFDSGATSGSPVPEPSSMFLLGVGLIGFARFRRKRFQK
jgi:hypothetical protein